MVDPFLRFWFRFIYSNRNAVEMENFDYIKNVIKRDFDTFSGIELEALCEAILIIEVKRQSKRYSHNKLVMKSAGLLAKLKLKNYHVEYQCFSLDNLDEVLNSLVSG